MEYRPLGRDGPDVSVLGFGAWPIGGGMGEVDTGVAVAAVRAAIDLGVTFIDTAQAYRTSETVLGKALKDGFRERCFLATKVSGDYSPDGIVQACENSLRELDVDCIDLYQIHSWNPDYPIEESIARDIAIGRGKEGELPFRAEFFYNQYSILCLLTPP